MLKSLLLFAAAPALTSAALAADAPPLPLRHVLQTAPTSASPSSQIVVAEVAFAKG